MELYENARVHTISRALSRRATKVVVHMNLRSQLHPTKMHYDVDYFFHFLSGPRLSVDRLLARAGYGVELGLVKARA